MKKITITEENFEEVLLKLQKICNKHTMIRFSKYYYYKNGEKYPDNVLVKPVNIRFNEKKNKTEHVLYRCFFNIEKHLESHRKDESKPLIKVQSGPKCYWFLRSGDQITFYPFGIFSTFTVEFFDTDKYEKSLYIPSFFKGKLTESDRNQILNRWEEVNRKIDL